MCPAVPHDFVSRENHAILFQGPQALLDGRVEVVMPALSALLPNAAVEVLGDD